MCLSGFCLGISFLGLITLSVYVSQLNSELVAMRQQVWNAKNKGSSAFSCQQLCGLSLPYNEVDSVCCIVKQSQDCRLKSDCFIEYIATKEKELSSMTLMDQYAVGLETIMFFVFLMNTYGVCYRYRRRDDTERRQAQRRRVMMASILIEVQSYAQEQNKKRKKILTESFISDQIEEMCAVCLQSFGEEKVIKLKCRHVFHRECIEEWVNNHTTCPVCRASQ